MELNSQEIPEIAKELGREVKQIHRWYLNYLAFINSTKTSNLVNHVRKMKDFKEFCVWTDLRGKKSMKTLSGGRRSAIRVPPGVTTDVELLTTNLKAISENDNFVPTADTFYRFALLFQAYPLDVLRSDYFGHMPHAAWAKFMKMFFSFYHANPEQVAMDLRAIRERSQTAIKNQIQKLTHIQDKEDDPAKILEYAKVIGTLSNQLSGISSQFAKDLSSLNLVGSRIKGGVNIQIINKIPRPHKNDFPNAEIKTIETDAVVSDSDRFDV